MLKLYLVTIITMSLLFQGSAQCCSKFVGNLCQICPDGTHLYRNNCILSIPYCTAYSDGFTCSNCSNRYILSKNKTCLQDFQKKFWIYDFPDEVYLYEQQKDQSFGTEFLNIFIKPNIPSATLLQSYYKTWQQISYIRLVVSTPTGYLQNSYQIASSRHIDSYLADTTVENINPQQYTLQDQSNSEVQKLLNYIRNYLFPFQAYELFQLYKKYSKIPGEATKYKFIFIMQRFQGLKVLQLSTQLLNQQQKTLNITQLSPDFLTLIQLAITTKNFTQYLLNAKLNSVTRITNTQLLVYNITYIHPGYITPIGSNVAMSYIVIEQSSSNLNRVQVRGYFMYIGWFGDPELDVLFQVDRVGDLRVWVDFVQVVDKEAIKNQKFDRQIWKILDRSYRQSVRGAVLIRYAHAQNQTQFYHYYQFKQTNVNGTTHHKFIFGQNKITSKIRIIQYLRSPRSKQSYRIFNSTYREAQIGSYSRSQTYRLIFNETVNKHQGVILEMLQEVFIKSEKANDITIVQCFTLKFYNPGQKYEFIDYYYQIINNTVTFTRTIYTPSQNFITLRMNTTFAQTLSLKIYTQIQLKIPPNTIQQISQSTTHPNTYKILTNTYLNPTTITSTLYLIQQQITRELTINTTYNPGMQQNSKILSNEDFYGSVYYENMLRYVQMEFVEEILGKVLVEIMRIDMRNITHQIFQFLYVQFDGFSGFRIVVSLTAGYYQLEIQEAISSYIYYPYLQKLQKQLRVQAIYKTVFARFPQLVGVCQLLLTNSSLKQKYLNITISQNDLIVLQPNGRQITLNKNLPFPKIQTLPTSYHKRPLLTSQTFRNLTYKLFNIPTDKILQVNLTQRTTLRNYIDTYTLDILVWDDSLSIWDILRLYQYQLALNFTDSATAQGNNFDTYQTPYRKQRTIQRRSSYITQRITLQTKGQAFNKLYEKADINNIIGKIQEMVYEVKQDQINVIKGSNKNTYLESDKYYLFNRPFYVLFNQNNTNTEIPSNNIQEIQTIGIKYQTKSNISFTINNSLLTQPQIVKKEDKIVQLLNSWTKPLVALTKRSFNDPEESKRFEVYNCINDNDVFDVIVEGDQIRQVLFIENGMKKGNSQSKLQSEHPQIHYISKIIAIELSQIFNQLNQASQNQPKLFIYQSPFNQPKRIKVTQKNLVYWRVQKLNQLRIVQFSYEVDAYIFKLKIMVAQKSNDASFYEVLLTDFQAIPTDRDNLRQQNQLFKQAKMRQITSMEEFKIAEKFLIQHAFLDQIHFKLIDVGMERNLGLIIFNVKYQTPYGIQQGTIAYSTYDKKPKIIKWQHPKPQTDLITQKNCKAMSNTGKGCLQCLNNFYLNLDGMCYPKIPGCQIQNGKICLSCIFALKLTSSNQCI